MIDASGFGIKVNIRASVTFPNGFTVTQFADDSDPIDFADTVIRESAMGLNGDKVSWLTPSVIPMTLSVIGGSDDDKNLQALYRSNRAARGKLPARDVITATVTYPDGRVMTLSGGTLNSGQPADGVASGGRVKSKTYTFDFENVQEAASLGF